MLLTPFVNDEKTSQYLDPIQEALGTEFKALLSSMGNSDVDPIYLKAQRWGGAFYSNADSSKDLWRYQLLRARGAGCRHGLDS